MDLKIAMEEIEKIISLHVCCGKDIKRIMLIVQNNPSFFGGLIAGDNCLKKAADKLETLVKSNKIIK